MQVFTAAYRSIDILAPILLSFSLRFSANAVNIDLHNMTCIYQRVNIITEFPRFHATP